MKGFDPLEFDFSRERVPKDEEEWCWLHETYRQAYRETPNVNLPPWLWETGDIPWTNVPAERRRRLAESTRKAFAHVKISDVLKKEKPEHYDLYECFFFFRNVDTKDIKDAFGRWLDETMARLKKPRKSRPGRPKDYRAALADLSIYRAAKMGFSREDCERLPELEWIKGFRGNAFRSDQFAKAKERVALYVGAIHILPPAR